MTFFAQANSNQSMGRIKV